MFFNISKILIFLTDPLFYIIILTFLGVLQFRRRKTFLAIFLLIYLSTIPFISKRLLYNLEHLEKPTFSETAKYDAAIVLSGMVNLPLSNNKYIEFSGAADRILKGIDIIKKGKADYLLLSGGTGSLHQKDHSEALLFSQFAKNLGVPEQAILIDKNSKNTHQNAVESKKIIQEKGLNRVLLITSAFHMFRSNGCFKQVGITADLLPVDYKASLTYSDFRDFLPSSSALHQNYVFLHELIGIIVYGLTQRASYQ